MLTFARQRFPLLLKDLQGFEGRGPILVEGAGLLPELVKPLLSSARQAMWLIPTEPFIVANWDRSKKRFLARQAADPAQARHALMTVDRLIAERLSVEAQSHEMPLLMVDGSQTPHEVATQVGEHFQPVLPAAT